MEQYKKWLEEQIEKCLNDKDLQREHWAYCTAYKKLIEALPIHGVVRGGDFERKSVNRDQVISKKETSELTPNTPTEPLGSGGQAKSGSGGLTPEAMKNIYKEELKYGHNAFE